MVGREADAFKTAYQQVRNFYVHRLLYPGKSVLCQEDIAGMRTDFTVPHRKIEQMTELTGTAADEALTKRLSELFDRQKLVQYSIGYTLALCDTVYRAMRQTALSIPGGEEVARRTFNPHIGVAGGLSILGTSGIVEPMSQQAILDTIQLEMNQAALRVQTEAGPRRLILAPGNYGLDYLSTAYPEFASIPVVKTSNFIGDTLDMAASAGFEDVLLVGHVGKLCKLAGGIMNTHSHTADCRTELFCTHAALCGASRETCRALFEAATTDACLDLLDTAGLRAPVLESLLAAVQLHLDRRAAGAFRVGAILFSNQHGPLGQTETAAQILNDWKER